MPRLFETEDVDRAQKQSRPKPRSTQRFETVDTKQHQTIFPEDTTEDLKKLASEMGTDDLDEVVIAALQILALAVNNDLEVQSKYKRGSKLVKNLWA